MQFKHKLVSRLTFHMSSLLKLYIAAEAAPCAGRVMLII